MSWSRSRSIQQLIVLAPPAASAPPTTTASISQTDGTPPSARNIGGTAVTSSSSMTRGLVSRMYDADVATDGPHGGVDGERDATVELAAAHEMTDLALHARRRVPGDRALERRTSRRRASTVPVLTSFFFGVESSKSLPSDLEGVRDRRPC